MMIAAPVLRSGQMAQNLTVTLFGSQLSVPLVIGPVGLAGLLWPDGECAAARAASAAGIAYCLSHGSVCNLETLASTGARPRWMQFFIYTDRGFSRELVQRAAAAGYEALILTIDNQLLGNRARDLRNGFSIPPSFTPTALLGMATKLPWLLRMRRELRRITFGNYAKSEEKASIAMLASRMAGLLDPAMNWQDVAWLRELWPGTLLLKGILHPAEAAKAVAQGVDGVMSPTTVDGSWTVRRPPVEAPPGVIAAITTPMCSTGYLARQPGPSIAPIPFITVRGLTREPRPPQRRSMRSPPVVVALLSGDHLGTSRCRKRASFAPSLFSGTLNLPS
jgi:isopentenyl diphosphate isomerase/L-lactate dehydrogenase-like FMN-dependent dehydrogenase